MKSGRSAARASWVIPLAIAAVTVVAFLPALRNGFVSFDDDKNFLDNPNFRGLGPAQLHWMWTTFHMGHYVPLSWMTLGLDYTLWGMNPLGYHLTSLLLHAANAVLVYAIARRLLEKSGSSRLEGREDLVTLGAATAALLFALHPLRVESVAWATERRDVLSAFFAMSSILVYLRAVEGPRPTARYWSAVALFACALLSKATTMTVPAVLAILNVYPLKRLGGSSGWWSDAARRVYAELIPFAALSAGAAVLSIVALHPPGQLGLGQKLAVSAYSLAFYSWKTLVPTGLAPLYEMPQHVDPTALRFLASYAIVLGLVAAAWLARRRAPALTAAIAAFVVISLPMLGVVQNGPQIAADRYTYHAAPALAILGATAFLMLPRPRALISVFGLAAVLGILGALTWRQTEFWRGPETLWSRVLQVDSASAIAQSAMANVRYKQDRVDEGIAFSERAVALAPSYAEGYNGLGVGLARRSRTQDAIRAYQRALALKPGSDEAENNLGIALASIGLADSAIVHYRRALEDESGQRERGDQLGERAGEARSPGRGDPALRARAGVAAGERRRPSELGRGARARIQVRRGRGQHFRAALAIDPGNADATAYLERATRLMQGGPPRT